MGRRGPRPMPNKPVREICRALRGSMNEARAAIGAKAAPDGPQGHPHRCHRIRLPAQRPAQAQARPVPRRPRPDARGDLPPPEARAADPDRIFEELRAQGCEGGCDAARRCAATWPEAEVAASAGAHVPPSFDPGEACQFDWRRGGSGKAPAARFPDGQIAATGGATAKIKAAHARLCRSRMVHVRAYPRESEPCGRHGSRPMANGDAP